MDNNDQYWGGPAYFNDNMTIYGNLKVYGTLEANVSIPGSIIQVVGSATSSVLPVSTSGFNNVSGVTGVSTSAISIVGNSNSRIIVNFTGNVFCSNSSGAVIAPSFGYAVTRTIVPPPQSIRTVGIASTSIFFSFNTTSIPASSSLTVPLSLNFVDRPTPIEKGSTVTYTLFVGVTGATPASILYNGSAFATPGILGLSNTLTGGFNPMTSTTLQEVLGFS